MEAAVPPKSLYPTPHYYTMSQPRKTSTWNLHRRQKFQSCIYNNLPSLLFYISGHLWRSHWLFLCRNLSSANPYCRNTNILSWSFISASPIHLYGMVIKHRDKVTLLYVMINASYWNYFYVMHFSSISPSFIESISLNIRRRHDKEHLHVFFCTICIRLKTHGFLSTSSHPFGM